MNNLLLDTCAVIWMGTNAQMRDIAVKRINDSYRLGRKVCVSPITAWELGGMVYKGRIRLKLSVTDWFENFTNQNAIDVCELTAHILSYSWGLPGNPPNDPADKIIIATARALNLSIITRDQLILNYAAEGYVDATVC